MPTWQEELREGLHEVFATLTTSQRKNSPHYCGAPGDGENAFPVPDAAHARNALARAHFSKDPAHVRKCVARIVKEEGWDVKVELGEEAPGELIVFSADVAPSGGEIDTMRALVFRCGDYPEQDFSLTEEEADEIIAEFSPVEARHGHPRSRGPLDGKMGTLTRIWRQGKEIFGLFDVPRWLTELIPEESRKLSLGFTRAPRKKITEWSWVTEPIISDAKLQSAFAEFAGRRHSQSDMRDMQQVHDISVRQGADCAPVANYGKEITMGEEQKKDAQGEGGNATQSSQAAPPQLPAEFALLKTEHDRAMAELKTLREESLALKAERRVERARGRVKDLVLSGKLLPAQFAECAANLAQAYADDEASPVLFAATEGGTKRNRADSLVAAWESNPLLHLTDERIPVTIFGGESAPDPAAAEKEREERRRRNLNLTPLGRASLQHEGGK